MLSLLLSLAVAQDDLVPGTPVADPQTLAAIGIQWPITGDADRDASVSVRYRQVGTTTWLPGPPLFRVDPASVVGWTIEDQFAGSILELRAGTDYEVELHATDPDGADVVETLVASTRAVPTDPASPVPVAVTDGASLQSALNSAAPGHVIELAAGTYSGTFSISADGTPADPIVIRGVDRDTVILDGGGAGGNVLEIYGSWTQVESLTIQNANRALRFQGDGAVGNAVRRVLARDVNLGFGADVDQVGFTICDNELIGPLAWPHVYTDDGGAFANVDGIMVYGHGHAVCHNRLIGWGDAIKIGGDGSRAIDFYGNDIASSYDNGIELDGGEGNTRAWRNRLTNNFAPISFQPVRGGPAYAVRNLVVNVAHENLKFHSLGGVEETSGILVWHNTFVRPHQALRLIDSTTSHNFEVVGNLFVGPASPDSGRTVEWTGDISGGRFDGNGWYPPDQRFDFDAAGDWPDFASMQAAGVFEASGVPLDGATFASGHTPAADYTTERTPPDLALALTSPALDAALPIPGINSSFRGAGPDLGALEVGCPVPEYGPRVAMIEGEPLEPCTDVAGGDTGTPTATGTTGTATGTGTGGSGTAGGGGGDKGGCGCGSAPGPGGGLALPALLMGLALRRRTTPARSTPSPRRR